MPYSTLAQIKERLPGITGTGFDTELTNLQTDTSREVDRRLQLVTSLPITDTTIKNDLAKHEADITAKRFQLRRAGAQERQQIEGEIREIWLEFDEMVANRFGYGVVIG